MRVLGRLFLSTPPPQEDIEGWIKLLLRNNRLTGLAKDSERYNGGLTRAENFRRVLTRVHERRGVPRQIEAVESAPSRDDLLAAIAPTTHTLILHGDADGLVPPSNSRHMYWVMAAAIRGEDSAAPTSTATSSSPSAAMSPLSTGSPRAVLPAPSLTTSPIRGEPKPAALEACFEAGDEHAFVASRDGRGSVRLAIIKDGGHELPDSCVAKYIPAALSHFARAEAAHAAAAAQRSGAASPQGSRKGGRSHASAFA